MTTDVGVLALDAMAVAWLHTAIGPDHYLPFIVMAKARRWSAARTAVITTACGLAHVGSSVLLGLVGYAAGASLRHLEWIESLRGAVAAWSLIVFGLLYAAWGLWRVGKRAPDGHGHDHLLRLHASDHVHNPKTGEEVSLTPWILFVIFLFGPCEPLIPLFIYPAATSGWGGALTVAGAFSAVTVVTMLAIVLAGRAGLAWVPQARWLRYQHVMAGGSIAATGLAIQTLGL